MAVAGAGLHSDSPAPAARGAPGVLQPPSLPCWGPGMKPHSAGHSGSPGLVDRGCATQRIQEHGPFGPHVVSLLKNLGRQQLGFPCSIC